MVRADPKHFPGMPFMPVRDHRSLGLRLISSPLAAYGNARVARCAPSQMPASLAIFLIASCMAGER